MVTKGLPKSAQQVMDEAHRRWHSFGHSYGNDITRAWIGLGYPSEYRKAVELGLVRCTREEKKGILGWYVFTPDGIAEYRRQHPTDDETLGDMVQ